MLRPSRSDQSVILSFRINRGQRGYCHLRKANVIRRIAAFDQNDLRRRSLLSLHMQYQSHIYNCFPVYKKA